MSDCQHRAPYCGDGDVDPVEVCDDGVNDGSAGGCSSDCLARTTDCGTPFLLWPAICREDLPDVMSDYEEPTLPTSSGTEVEATTIAGINAALPGSEITITADMHEWTFLSGEDKDLIIADGVTVDALVIDTCMRCRARGGGPNARIKYLYVHNAQDVTVDSVLIKADSAYSERAVEIQMSDRIALISTVFHSPYSAAMFTSHVNGLLIAGSSWASSDAGGVNDWGSRFADTSDVVIVDSQIEARGMQPVLRRGGGFSMRHFYLRTTTVNLDSAESTLDLGGETQDGFDQMYQQSPTYYISNLSAGPLLRYGGSPNDDAGMGLYEVTDATWHTPPSGDSAYMGEADLASRESSVWKYRLGTPTFDATLSGTYEERHPGWPARGSRTLGVPLSESNPFDL